MPLGSNSLRVELTFWRDKALSDATFWDRVGESTGITYPIPHADSPDPQPQPQPQPQRSVWTVLIGGEPDRITATSVGDRDDWSEVRSNGDGYTAVCDGDLLELDGHEINAVFTYLDVRPLLARAGSPARQHLDGSMAEVAYIEPDAMATLTRALALVEGGDQLDVEYDPTSGIVRSVQKFAAGRICESVSVAVDGEPSPAADAHRSPDLGRR